TPRAVLRRGCRASSPAPLLAHPLEQALLISLARPLRRLGTSEKTKRLANQWPNRTKQVQRNRGDPPHRASVVGGTWHLLGRADCRPGRRDTHSVVNLRA